MDTPCSPGSNEFSRLVAGEYLSFFDFSGLTLDRALRSVGLGQGSAHRCYRLHIWILMLALSNLTPLGRLGKGPSEQQPSSDSVSAHCVGAEAVKVKEGKEGNSPTPFPHSLSC